MSSACVCHTDEWCFYCNMFVPLERKYEEQAKEIESLQREIKSHAPEGRNYTNGQYVELLLKFESEKAIAELAVKALEHYAKPSTHPPFWTHERGQLAREALEEIKRLGEGVNK